MIIKVKFVQSKHTNMYDCVREAIIEVDADKSICKQALEYCSNNFSCGFIPEVSYRKNKVIYEKLEDYASMKLTEDNV